MYINISKNFSKSGIFVHNLGVDNIASCHKNGQIWIWIHMTITFVLGWLCKERKSPKPLTDRLLYGFLCQWPDLQIVKPRANWNLSWSNMIWWKSPNWFTTWMDLGLHLSTTHPKSLDKLDNPQQLLQPTKRLPQSSAVSMPLALTYHCSWCLRGKRWTKHC